MHTIGVEQLLFEKENGRGSRMQPCKHFVPTPEASSSTNVLVFALRVEHDHMCPQHDCKAMFPSGVVRKVLVQEKKTA